MTRDIVEQMEGETYPEDTEVTPEWKDIQVSICDSHENPA